MKLLPAIIIEASKQSQRVQRFVDYCRELDGTQIRVIKLPTEIDVIPHPVGIELGFRYAAAMFDEPFLYLEPDSIPLSSGWLQKITEEYHAAGKLFMLPSLEGCPVHDVASGIGVWPAQAQKYFHTPYEGPPLFDLYAYKNLVKDIHFTKQILHRYGKYEDHRVVGRYEFPQDRSILTPEAVIFHADPTQSIIRGGLLQSYYHSGDLGDIVAALPIIKQRGGGMLYLGPPHVLQDGKNPCVGINSYLSGIIAPLLECQSYVRRVEFKKWQDVAPDYDLSTFRFMEWNKKENLGEWQGRFVGRADLDMGTWLEVPDPEWTGRVIVSRSLKYHNDLFPWKWIAEKFCDRILFVGWPEEHSAWERLVERKVERAETCNLLDMAKVLAGAELHFGNQSLPAWITMGLGKTMIMEVWPDEPNSIVRNCPKSIFAQTRQDMDKIKETFQDAYTINP